MNALLILALAVSYEYEGLRLSAFKHRGAKLNRAIFQILAIKGPLTAYQVYKHIRERKEFEGKHYSVINRRIRKLQGQGYLKIVGETRTKAGFQASLYELTAKAYLALLLKNINFETLLERINEQTALALIAELVKLKYMSVF